MQCQVSKWPVLIAMDEKADARELALLMAEHCFSMHGWPASIVSDAGPQMASALSKELSEVFQFSWEFSSPYHQQSNPAEAMARQVFKVHRAESWMPEQIKSALLSLAQKDNNWDKKMNLLLLPYRNSDHSSTGRSPAELLYGIRLRMPPDHLLETRKSYAEEPATVAELIEITVEGEKLAVAEIERVQQERKVRFDENVYDPVRVGDRVRLKVEHHQPGTKLRQLKWKGPYTVMEKDMTRNAALLRDACEPDKETFWASLSKMKPTKELFPALLRSEGKERAAWGRYGRRAKQTKIETPPQRASRRLAEQRAKLNAWYLDYARRARLDGGQTTAYDCVPRHDGRSGMPP